MGKNKHNSLTPLDTSSAGPHRGGPTAEGQVVSLGEMGDHIEKLKQVSVTAKSLMNLLGDQLQGLSATIPVLRGFEIVRLAITHRFRSGFV